MLRLVFGSVLECRANLCMLVVLEDSYENIVFQQTEFGDILSETLNSFGVLLIFFTPKASTVTVIFKFTMWK